MSFLLYVVQHFATRGRSVLSSDFLRPIFKVRAVTKLVERGFFNDLALVLSPEVACGFKYDSNRRGLLTPPPFIALLATFVVMAGTTHHILEKGHKCLQGYF